MTDFRGAGDRADGVSRKTGRKPDGAGVTGGCTPDWMRRSVVQAVSRADHMCLNIEILEWKNVLKWTMYIA